MSNSYKYNPVPPRAWSRVQNQCTYTNNSNYQQIYIPLTKQTVTLNQANYEDKLLQKGNILQYKGNSSQLTKKQKYSQLAKGFGPNRTKVFATQSQTYTNPNTNSLARVNYTEIPFPNTIVGQPNNISGPFQYNVSNPFDCSSNVLQSGGNLVCGTYADPCSGAIIKQGVTSAVICNPASASNVPGSSLLCWNTNVQTWFPRQRYFMNNSGNKWPQGYKAFVSAVNTLEVVSILSASLVPNDNTMVTLNWSDGKKYCSDMWELYQNGIFLNSYPAETTTTITGLVPGTTYTYFVICQNSCGIATQSNTITVQPINDIIQQIVDGNYIYTLQLGALYYNNVTVIGGGGGGGGGPVMGTENNSGKIGGSGGGGGGITIINSNVSITTQTALIYTVGIGGVGGNLSSGTSGLDSSFTDVVALINLTATGGSLGLYNDTLFPDGNTTFNSGGAGGTGTGGNINGTGGVGGNSGGVGSLATGFSPASTPGGISNTPNGSGGGGGGGCIFRTSGTGGIYLFSDGANGGNGGAGAIGGIAGSVAVIVGNGSGTIGFGGSGGGGVGGNNVSGSGIQTQNGGNGLYGSGGGGSGACHTSGKEGFGGNGGTGFVGFTVYRMVIS